MIIRVDLFIYELGFVVLLFDPAQRGTMPAARIESVERVHWLAGVADRRDRAWGLFPESTRTGGSWMRKTDKFAIIGQTIDDCRWLLGSTTGNGISRLFNFWQNQIGWMGILAGSPIPTESQFLDNIWPDRSDTHCSTECDSPLLSRMLLHPAQIGRSLRNVFASAKASSRSRTVRSSTASRWRRTVTSATCAENPAPPRRQGQACRWQCCP